MDAKRLYYYYNRIPYIQIKLGVLFIINFLHEDNNIFYLSRIILLVVLYVFLLYFFFYGILKQNSIHSRLLITILKQFPRSKLFLIARLYIYNETIIR